MHYRSFQLEERDGVTVLRFTDAIHGRVDDKTADHEGWQLLFD